jgi:hypothetical protein
MELDGASDGIAAARLADLLPPEVAAIEGDV